MPSIHHPKSSSSSTALELQRCIVTLATANSTDVALMQSLNFIVTSCFIGSKNEDAMNVVFQHQVPVHLFRLIFHNNKQIVSAAEANLNNLIDINADYFKQTKQVSAIVKQAKLQIRDISLVCMRVLLRLAMLSSDVFHFVMFNACLVVSVDTLSKELTLLFQNRKQDLNALLETSMGESDKKISKIF